MSSPFGVVLFSLALSHHSLALNPADVGNGATTLTRPTAIGNFSFTSEPRGRGTIGLILSCSVTLGFCVWTVVHPNVVADAGTASRFLYKATMMLVSIVIPEGLILCAYGQRRDARRIYQAWQEKFKDSEDKGYLGMDGAFFVVMGGFVIDRATSISSRKCFWCRLWPELWVKSPDYTATLTPAGFLFYLEKGWIGRESFEKQDIVDKDKGNRMSKSISGFQAIWLIVNCISRMVEHLPLSLLEIHVLIQVVCTLVIYFCWWHKPLDVNEPIAIKLLTTDLPLPLTGRRPEDLEKLEKSKGGGRPFSRNFIVKRCPRNPIAVVANAFYDIVVYVDGRGDETDSLRSTFRLSRRSVIQTFITGAVGLLHGVAWNSHFPTLLEKWLWRIASIGMCFFPLVALTILLFTLNQLDLIDIIWDVHLHLKCSQSFLAEVGERLGEVASKKGGSFSVHMRLMHFYLCSALVYFMCVSYITVESYASVRDPAAGTMITPRWSNYWPHVQ